MFLDNSPDVMTFAHEIIQKYPKLINPYVSRETADPFIMALARSLKSNVTNSKPILIIEGNDARVDGIPHVSRMHGLESLKLTGMFQSEKWTF